MNSFLLSGVAIATVLMLQSAPASAQRVHGVGHAHVGHVGHVGRGYAGHGGYAHGYRPGYGVGVGAAALATGAIIGGAIASQNQGYYPDQNYSGYSPDYAYEAPPVAYNNGGSVAYCEQTYRSYDPASGSYLGYDGIRHPCP